MEVLTPLGNGLGVFAVRWGPVWPRIYYVAQTGLVLMTLHPGIPNDSIAAVNHHTLRVTLSKVLLGLRGLLGPSLLWMPLRPLTSTGRHGPRIRLLYNSS